MYRDILLAVDLDDEASWREALPIAVEYARAFGSVLHVMTVVPAMGTGFVGSFFPADFERKAMEAARRRLHGFARAHVGPGIPVQHVVAHGSVYKEVLRVSEEIACDLIVVAASGPDLGTFLLGPNAARIVRHARRSVLVVRSRDGGGARTAVA